MICLCVEIVGIDIKRKLDFLYVGNLLLFLGFLFSLVTLETELAVVDDLAYRRICLRRNKYEIEISVIGCALCCAVGQESELLAFGTDYTEYLRIRIPKSLYVLVDIILFCVIILYWKTPPLH